MAKFATPVAMKVTKEQFTRDLEEPLKALGYIKSGYLLEGYLVTQECGINDEICYYSDGQLFNERHLIEEYNPELFLAIAAMTEDKIPIVGEWLSYKVGNRLFRVNRYGKTNNYTNGTIDIRNPSGSGYFLKATLEELTNHFSKPKETFVLPEKWKLEVTKENVSAVNRWKKSLYKDTTVIPGNAVNQDGYWCGTIDMSPKNTEITTEQFMEHVYNPAFNTEIPKEFYIHYCEGFTEDIFHALYDWAKVHSSGKLRDHDDTYRHFSRNTDKFWRFNFIKVPNIKYGGDGYGVDNHDWGNEVNTEYSLEQVKELINYKPKTNKNEYKEDSYESESRESIKQIDEDLDSISSREGGKEIKIRTVSSRNLCQRGSIESSNSITSPRGSSSRIRAERGRLYI